jgi:asparagine synthase (glutamine-hydrolysing)
MPGLAGFASGRLDVSVATGVLKRMQESLVHDEGYVRASLFTKDRISATAVDNRVRKNLLQPYGDRGVYVWLDGEFYNREELARSASCTVASDAELLAFALRKDDGFALLSAIDGIFAAVVYDSRNEKVHLISDRLGLRHLNWTITNGSLAWASELKALLHVPGSNPRIRRDAVSEFFNIGWLLDNGTWLEGVELVPAATVVTFDIGSGRVDRHRYWWWDQIKPLGSQVDAAEVNEEYGRLFREAVRRRCDPSARVWVPLSGGLDSRAIFAAVSQYQSPDTVTFGQKDCDDIRISRRVAGLGSGRHRVVEIDSNNWLNGRIDSIWWTDGRKDLAHAGIVAAYRAEKGSAEIVFDGLAGGIDPQDDLPLSIEYAVRFLESDFGCRIREDPELLDRFRQYVSNLMFPGAVAYDLYADCRVRSFTINGPKLATFLGMNYRLPFLDAKLQEFWHSARLSGHPVTRSVWLSEFPEHFRNIPWKRTGVPLNWWLPARQAARVARGAKRKLAKIFSSHGYKVFRPIEMADNAGWLRQEPARMFVEKLLTDDSALYPEYIGRDRVVNAWYMHLAGKDVSGAICRYMTFEIWLKQLFEGKYRPTRVER